MPRDHPSLRCLVPMEHELRSPAIGRIPMPKETSASERDANARRLLDPEKGLGRLAGVRGVLPEDTRPPRQIMQIGRDLYRPADLKRRESLGRMPPPPAKFVFQIPAVVEQDQHIGRLVAVMR